MLRRPCPGVSFSPRNAAITSNDCPSPLYLWDSHGFHEKTVKTKHHTSLVSVLLLKVTGGTAAGTWQDTGESLHFRSLCFLIGGDSNLCPILKISKWDDAQKTLYKRRFSSTLRMTNYTVDHSLQAFMYQLCYSGLDLRPELRSDNEDHTRATTFSCTRHDIC